MKPRTLLIIALAVAMPVVLLLLIANAGGSDGTAATAIPPSSVSNGRAESAGEPVESDARSTEASETVELPVSSEQSGPALLESHCAQCHSVKLLERTRKSRAEWEKILSRMERYSGLVDESEKLLVLDQLVGPDKP